MADFERCSRYSSPMYNSNGNLLKISFCYRYYAKTADNGIQGSVGATMI